MAFLVLALGAFLSICGAFSILYGYGIVEVERGWTAVIAGTTALTGGMIIIALGLILRSVKMLLAPLQQRSTIERTAGTNQIAATAVPEDLSIARNQVVATGHDLRLPVAPSLPSATLMTPELESSMMAAILSTRDLDSRDRATHPGETPYADDTEQVSERGEMRPVHINALLETQRDPNRDPLADTPPPLREAPEPQAEPPEDKPRFKVSFRRPVAAPPDRETETLPLETMPRETMPRETLPPEPEPLDVAPREPAPPVVEEAAAPAMDDWLDRAFSALDSEVPPNPDRPRSPPLEDVPKTLVPEVDHAMAHAERGAMAAEAAPRHELAPPEPPVPSPAPTSAVIGRYEADGTSYVMYADGSIEAHSEAGVDRFSSMAELKAYIENAA